MATLNVAQLLATNIEAFRKRVPLLSLFGSDFGQLGVRYNQQVIGRIRTLPTASTYSAGSGGYKNGAQSARGLLTDVPLTLDQWGTVPIKMEHLYTIQDSINDYTGVVGDGGYVLGKQVVDHVLAKADFAHFSESSTYSTDNCDVDMLINVGGDMNARTKGGDRVMIVNTAVASTLAADQRLINAEWFGNPQGGNALRAWRNVFGFSMIVEYPDLPSGTSASTINITGEADTEVITTASAHGFNVGDRVQVASLSGGTGIADGYFYVKTAPTDTTLTLSSSIGGAVAAFSTDIVSGTIKKATNLAAVAFERNAFAVAGGAPPSVTEQLGAQFGIPMNTIVEAMMDPETQTAMGMAKWQENGTADLYVCPTIIYGARAGRELAAAAGTTCDYAGHLIITA